MDLLHIIINQRKSNICSLCFGKSSHLADIYDDLEIHDEYNSAFKTNFYNIIRSLFPSHDLLLPQVCEDCSTLILKTFNLIHKSCRKNKMLHYLLDNLNDELDLKYFDGIKTVKCRLKINLSQNGVSHKNTEVICQKCSMKFRSEYLLKKHIKISHENANNAIICDTCGKTFNSNTQLNAHLGCHIEKECPYCLKIFKSHSYFKLHVRNHKSPNIVKRRIKYLKCNDCDYQSINKCTLQAHINKLHLNFRPFKCEICQKGFYKKDNLIQHSVTHEKNKPNICFVCGDRFIIERTLREHIKLHTGQKPYSCDICKLGFVTSGRRYEHIKRKHTEKNESCIICEKKFSLKKDLNTHIKKVHGDAK